MKLHESIKVVLNQLGYHIITKDVFVNALRDFHAFLEVPSSKHVLKDIITEGYAEKIEKIYQGSGDWQFPFQNLVYDFVQKHAYKEDLASYVFSCISYGIGWIDSVVDYSPISANIQFVSPTNSSNKPTTLHSNKIEVVFDYDRHINFAIQQNSFAFARELSIKNVSATPLSNLKVQLIAEPDFADPWEIAIDSLNTLEESKFFNLPITLSATFLAQISSGITGSIKLHIFTNQEVLFDFSFAVELDGYNYWNGLAVRPDLIASFVLPRHPALSTIIHRASEILESWTGSSAFDEYQTRNQNQAKLQAAAIFDAIRERKVVFASSSIDYTRAGDRIRLVDEILSDRIASELDMAVFYASCLESVGLHPLILFTEQHVVSGLWLIPDTFADSVNDDLSLITKRTPEGINEILLIDVQSLFASFNNCFDAAVISANSLVSDVDSFLLFVDLTQARFSNIRPLPIRINSNGGVEIVEDSPSNNDTSKPQSVFVDDAFFNQDGEVSKQTIWERRLLDLGLRNNLLNTRIGRRSLQLMSVNVNQVEDILADGQDIRISAVPDGYQSAMNADGLYQAPQPNDSILQRLQQELKQNRLRSYLEEDDLTKALTDLYRLARTSLEENGANTLYMSIGMLKWYETPVSTKARFAPILLFPIEIVRKSVPKGYVIRGRGEDTVVNITLLEKLRQDFKITINGLDPLPLDKSGVDVHTIFNVFRKAIMSQSRWNVEEMVVIGNFSFNKFLMWNDIHNNADVLRQNNIVKSLMDGKLAFDCSNGDAEQIDLDRTFSVGDLALPMSADSSQIEAISTAISGKSFVLHGPPGTGKSQTITNIIANALYRGKKVLFVAEKMAALQVVQHRLEMIGLAPFCLELHSSKSKKSSVMEQLKRTTEITKYKNSQQFQLEAQQINDIRKELNDFVSAIHKVRAIGLSVYDCMSRFGERDQDITPIPLPNQFVETLDESKVRDCERVVNEYAAICEILKDVPNHAYFKCGIAKNTPSLKQDLSERLQKIQGLIEKYRSDKGALFRTLKIFSEDSESEMHKVASLILTLQDCAEIIEKLLDGDTFNEDYRQVMAFVQKGFDYRDKKNRVMSVIGDSYWGLDVFVCRSDLNLLRHFGNIVSNPSKGQSASELFDTALTTSRTYAEMIEKIKKLLGVPQSTGLDGEGLLKIVDLLLSSSEVLLQLFGASDLDGQIAKIKNILAHVRKKNELKDSLLAQCRNSIFTFDIDGFSKEWESASMKWFLSRIIGQNKLKKQISLHAIHELKVDQVPAVIACVRDYHREEQTINDLNRFEKGFWGSLWNGENVDTEKIEKALLFHESLHKELLHLTRDITETNNIEHELSKHLSLGFKAFHAVEDVLLNDFVDSYNAVKSCVESLSEHGVDPFEELRLLEETQTLSNNLKKDDSLWVLKDIDLDSCDWDKLSEQIDNTRKIRDEVLNLVQENENPCQALHVISDWYRQGKDEQIKSFVSIPECVREIRELYTQITQMLDFAIDDLGQNFVSRIYKDFNLLLADIDGLNDIIQYNIKRGEIDKVGLTCIDDAVRSGRLPSNDIADSYKYGLYKSYIEYIVATDSVLSAFHSGMFEKKIRTFRTLCDRFEDLTRQELYVKLASALPNFQIEASKGSEVGILQRNIRNGARNISLRTLFDQISDLLIRICPCMLMSPMSVAQYINASGLKFDLVIFDEASQMPTCEAVGAIARGENIIVVGDPNQLPPTTFFVNNQFDEDNADKEDLDSILEDCLALSIPSKYLLWHYRSKHESLIAFSNAQFYENKLLTFPSPDDITSKVTFRQINGFYDRSRSRQNRAEADGIIAEIKRRLSDSNLSKQSIGVVTFNSNQQSLIEDLLNELLEKNPYLEKLATEVDEPIFVKNLENVQGDERDVILFSVGYGPDKTGKISYNFGPLNREGGWRRLNVAVSRARYEMIVFSTLLPDQIDENRSSAEGVRSLKMFLSYAQKGVLMPTKGRSEVDKEKDGVVMAIAEALTTRGYQVRLNIGSSDYKMDLAIVDPMDDQKYIMGIICDGYNYYSARTARDREITRYNVLKLLGWKLFRVWAMDWWNNPGKLLDSVIAAINSVKEGEWSDCCDEKLPPLDNVVEIENSVEETSTVNENGYHDIVYTEAELRYYYANSDDVAAGCYEDEIRDNIQKLIDAESPISKHRLCKKIMQSFGIARMGDRLSGYMDYLLTKEGLKYTIVGGDVFYWKRFFSLEEYKTFRKRFDREPLDIAPEEVSNAICKILLDQGSLPEEELIKYLAKLFGFGSVRDIVFKAMHRGLLCGIKSGRIEKIGERIKIKNI
jgi:hypothetical protein